MFHILVTFCLVVAGHAFAEETATPNTLPAERPYVGEMAQAVGAAAFYLPKPSVIYVNDEQLDALCNPDAEVDVSLSAEPKIKTLRQICEEAKAMGARTLIVAFDHFFSQYRPGQGDKPRTFTPDSPAFIDRVARISRFAQDYGLGLELSILSPLEIGPNYRTETGESGLWLHAVEGVRDPVTGRYSVEFWRQVRWANNKGPIDVEDAGVRVFAFREAAVGSVYRSVNPDAMFEITNTAQVDVYSGLRSRAGNYEAVRVRVFADSSAPMGLDRVLVVQQYRTPEMDYFSENALPYLQHLIDRYYEAGVVLHGLYADEMHIQQDWAYFHHHDNDRFALRYVSPGFARAFAAKYGENFADFARYMIYFVQGRETFSNNLGKDDCIHVWGETPEAVAQTALFRARYYHTLQDGVVDLFATAKRYAEQRYGYRLEARAHATWAESPTIDLWRVDKGPSAPHQYEYTPRFVWSNTVHQAASACYDYFKWGEFLTGNGNDHAEGGWLDRNYFALALGCSTGIINDVPYSYAAHWGMPDAVARRRQALVNTYGAFAQLDYALVQNFEHRIGDVLFLYPLDLVAWDERFGSWMTQYGYADYLPSAVVVKQGRVENGRLHIAGRKYATVVALFEPFPPQALAQMLAEMAIQGGTVVWSAMPPLYTYEGADLREPWAQFFGVGYTHEIPEGLAAPGFEVRFEGLLQDLPPMTVLTDFLVDRTYPVVPQDTTEVLARIGKHVVATRKKVGEGQAVFLGFRPRDDQAQSLGYEARWWFEILTRLGAYQGSSDALPNDNPNYLSRTTDYLFCRFPNGAIAAAPHLRTVEEAWSGGFLRDPEKDRERESDLGLPSDSLVLHAVTVDGFTIDYEGRNAVTFRPDRAGNVHAFAGAYTRGIRINTLGTYFSDTPFAFALWAPLPERLRVPNGATWVLRFVGEGDVLVPLLPPPSGTVSLYAQGATWGSRGEEIPVTYENGKIRFRVTPELSGRYLFVTETQVGNAQSTDTSATAQP